MQHTMEEQIKSNYEDALSNALETKAQQTQQHMNETMQFQRKIDKLIEEKTALNDKYQLQLNQVLREKEELIVSKSSLEDKIQKLELDREHLKLKNKQIQADLASAQTNLEASKESLAKIKKQNDNLKQKIEDN